MKLRQLIICLLAFICFPTQATPLLIQDQLERVPLGEHLLYLEDMEGGLGLRDVRNGGDQLPWISSDTEVPSFGFTRSAFWFKVQLTADTTQRRLIELGYPRLDHINVYVLQDGRLAEEFELGDQFPYPSRPVDFTNFLFPVELAADRTTELVIRVETASAMQLPVMLWDPDSFISHTHEQSFMDGLIYGFLAALAAYHLMIFLQVRESSFLYLTLYILSISLALATLGGKAFGFIWPQAIAWNEVAFVFMGGCSVLFSCLFNIHTLKLNTHRPRLTHLIYGLGFTGLGMGLLAFLIPYDIAVQMFLVVTSLALLTNIFAYVLRSFDRFQPAYYLLGSALAITLALTLMGISALGLMPPNRLAANIALVGACLHFLLFAMALAARMRLDRKAREEAQRENSQTQALMLSAQQNLTERLESLVTERTAALRSANLQLQSLSNSDPLTNLCNRRHFNEVLEKEFKRSRRDHSPLSLLVIDVDHFKRINDTYGHPFGDQCLIKVGEILSEGRRPADLCARYGGEEFVLLLPDTPLAGAVSVAEMLRNVFAASELQSDGIEVTLTVSIGVATLAPQADGDTTSLLKAADRQLYIAKKEGRNCVASIAV